MFNEDRVLVLLSDPERCSLFKTLQIVLLQQAFQLQRLKRGSYLKVRRDPVLLVPRAQKWLFYKVE